ncbi:ArdC-like ssDNA-binding domain-containing protein [Metamycoplasma auris]|uniref:ArdC-like ssDNA-binding domain-containing protein n=1 Tax=Metamycoplasma auris TaxID=51363 RepID=UPI0003A160F4|nr:ArdC-like ssDNA-binding domain-containing protein [Metamycoplasma auris]
MQDFLSFSAQIKSKYSYRNTNWIKKQYKGASIVKTYSDWKKDNIEVRKGQHGIKILRPIFAEVVEIENKVIPKKKWDDAILQKIKNNELEVQNVLRSFGISYVFDISQTFLPKEKYPKNYFDSWYRKNKPDPTLDEKCSIIFNVLSRIIERKGWKINTDATLGLVQGQTTFLLKEIKLNKLNELHENLNTLFHEYAHILCEHDKSKISLGLKEYQAELVAYTCHKHINIEVKEHSFKYMKGWLKDINASQKRAIVDQIIRVSKEIVNELEDELRAMELETNKTIN